MRRTETRDEKRREHRERNNDELVESWRELETSAKVYEREKDERGKMKETERKGERK